MKNVEVSGLHQAPTS